MRTETTTRTLYTYSELSDKAKEAARDWYREASAGDDFYSESVVEDIATICDCVGLDIRQTRKTRGNGSHYYAPTVCWSGFWSQGDGACFEGIWHAHKLHPGELVEHAPHDTELARIAEVFERIAKAYPDASFSVKHRGHYYHSGCTAFDFDMNPPEDSDDTARSAKEWDAIRARDSEIESELRDACRALMDWFYSQLEKAYDWQNADEQVADNIEANEYEFTENGKRA